MHLNNISLLNFKNYPEGDLGFTNHINCFVGNNGVGKTNLLDAIHYLALCKSYFNTIDSQNIKHNEDIAVIQGVFSKGDKKDEVYCCIQHNKRKIFKRNKKEYTRLADHIGLFPLVMISPADSRLIMEGSEERRRFMNSVIAQYDKNYIENLLIYNRALTQRNKLLKDISSGSGYDREILDIYDVQLIDYGTKIHLARKDFALKIQPVFRKYYHTISSGMEDVDLSYESQLFESDMRSLLKSGLKKDILLQFTTSGIHKDDLRMNLGEQLIKRTGSQGQQKTYQVALKLAKFHFIKDVTGITPVLLLDDIFDKFDALRMEQIIKLVIDEDFGQIFITDTDRQHLRLILKKLNSEHRVFNILQNQKIELVS